MSLSFSSLSLSIWISISYCSLSLVGSLFLCSITMTMIARSVGSLSLYTRPYLALRTRVRGPWPIPCPVNMFAPCKKPMSEDSCASLVPLGMKWACICTGKKNVLGVVWCVCAVCLCVLLCDVVVVVLIVASVLESMRRLLW